MNDIFDRSVAEALVSRIEQLSPMSERLWGTMTVDQMLAHCSVPFDTVYSEAYLKDNPRPNVLMRSLLRVVAKPIVVGPKPYKRNMRTASSFVITDARDFDREQARLIDYVQQVQQDGVAVFEGKESHSFGPLTAREWSALFYKHTDHHLTQFGV